MIYLLKRLAYLGAILVAVTFAVSLLIDFLPGDPAVALLGEDATPDQIEALRRKLDLDEPILERYLSWLTDALSGDLGDSLRSGQPVRETIFQRLPVSIELVIAAQVLALAYAVPTAIYGAYRANSKFDKATRLVSSTLISVPPFLIAIVAVQFAAVNMGWFPVSGFTPISEDLFDNLRSIALPALAIAAEPAGVYQRLLRTDLAATLREDYVGFARSKGLSARYVLLRHAMRPSTFSLTTIAGINTGKLIGGAIVVETIFALPGIGRLLINGIFSRDLVIIQGVVAVVTIGYVVVNTLVDLTYAYLDPRVRDHT